MQIRRSFKFLDNDLLIKPHEDELLNGVSHQVVVDQLLLTVLPDLLEDRSAQLCQELFVNDLSE